MFGLHQVWERWRAVTTYPLLWVGVYAVWLAFTGGLLFVLTDTPRNLAAAAFAALAFFPLALLALSNWLARSYDPNRPR